MKAMIFAAGLGTRLKPYTDHHPKALVTVQGVPMLERIITKLKVIGVSEIVVNVHHFANQILDFLKSNDDFGIKIHISDESQCLLDTGGGILAARKWLDKDTEPFIVHNADILTDIPIKEMYDCARCDGAMATLLVAKRDTSRYLLFDQSHKMHGWTNIKTGEVKPSNLNITGLNPLAFGGVHILSPKIFEFLANYKPSDAPFPIMDFYINYCSIFNIYGFMTPKQCFWHDIGKPEALRKAEEAILS